MKTKKEILDWIQKIEKNITCSREIIEKETKDTIDELRDKDMMRAHRVLLSMHLTELRVLRQVLGSDTRKNGIATRDKGLPV